MFEGRRFGNGFCNGFNGYQATDFVTDLTDIRDLIPDSQLPIPNSQSPNFIEYPFALFVGDFPLNVWMPVSTSQDIIGMIFSGYLD